MKSGWVDRDAQAMVDRYARDGVGADLALRVYTTRLLGRDPQARAARRRQHLGEDRDARPARRGGRGALRQGLGRRHGDDRARRACRRCGSTACASCARATRSPTRTWCASSARTCSIRRRPIRRSRRCCTPSCRTNSSTTPTRPRCSSLVDQPDGEAICAEVYDGRVGVVPYIMPGFALAKAAAEVFERDAERRRADPAQARHLHLRRQRARSL